MARPSGRYLESHHVGVQSQGFPGLIAACALCSRRLVRVTARERTKSYFLAADAALPHVSVLTASVRSHLLGCVYMFAGTPVTQRL